METITNENLEEILNAATVTFELERTEIEYRNDDVFLFAFIENKIPKSAKVGYIKQRKIEHLECELNSEWYELSRMQKESIRKRLELEIQKGFDQFDEDIPDDCKGFDIDDYTHFKSLIYKQ